MKNLSNILTGNGQEFLKSISKAQANMKNNINKINYHFEEEVKFNPSFYYSDNRKFHIHFKQRGIDAVSYTVKGSDGNVLLSEMKNIDELEKDENNMYHIISGEYSKPIYANVIVEFSASSGSKEIYSQTLECEPKVAVFQNFNVNISNNINAYILHQNVKHYRITVINTRNDTSSSYEYECSLERGTDSYTMKTTGMGINKDNYSLKTIIVATDADGNELDPIEELFEVNLT